MSPAVGGSSFPYANARTRISFAVTARLIGALVFRYMDSTIPLFLNPKFQVPNQHLGLYNPVCVGPRRKP